MHLQKDLYEDVHGSFAHIIQKLESVQTATRGTNKINKLWDIHTVVYYAAIKRNYNNKNKFKNHEGE